MKEEMLRDRIVVGIRDRALSEKLQMDSELTLEKAKKAARQKEAVNDQHKQMQGGQETTLAAIKRRPSHPRRGPHQHKQATPSGNPAKQNSASVVVEVSTPWTDAQLETPFATSATTRDTLHHNASLNLPLVLMRPLLTPPSWEPFLPTRSAGRLP